MVDLDSYGRGRKLAAAGVVAVVLIAGAFLIGRFTAPEPAAGTASTVPATSGAAVSPPYTAAPPTGAPATALPDGGQGWTVPNPGAGHGPTSRTDAGVPYGYTKDEQGAALAAVNAVIGGLWLKQTMVDPWGTLGFLAADPTKSPAVSGALTSGEDGVRDLLGPSTSTVAGSGNVNPRRSRLGKVHGSLAQSDIERERRRTDSRGGSAVGHVRHNDNTGQSRNRNSPIEPGLAGRLEGRRIHPELHSDACGHVEGAAERVPGPCGELARIKRVARRGVVLLIAVSLLLGLDRAVAAAEPAGPGSPSTQGSDPTKSINTDDVTVKTGRWPSELLWAVPGTKEFKQKYSPSSTALPHYTPVAGCGIGSDVYGYTKDFVANLGNILGAMTKASGKGTLPELSTPNDKGGAATTPWKPITYTELVQQGHGIALNGGRQVVATASPGRLIPFVDPDTGNPINDLTSGRQPCATDFAPYGVPAASSPFGFGFYPAPDEGAMSTLLAHVSGYIPKGANQTSDGWWVSKDTLAGWDFRPTDWQNYCTDKLNPLCLTATFLKCPTSDGGTVKEKAAITNCRIWNANVLLMNAYLTIALQRKGAGFTADGKFKSILAGGDCPGSDCGPLGEWLTLLQSGRTIDKAATGYTWGLAALGVVVVAGAFLVGGLAAGLVALGIVGVIAAAAITVFGKLDCATDLANCLAGYSSSSMFTMLDAIPSAALGTGVPDMTGSDYRALFNTIAGIAAWVLIVLFLIATALALLRLRPGEAVVSFVGLIKFGFILGAGGALLTMFVQVRDAVSVTLAGAGGAETIIGTSEITDRIRSFSASTMAALTAAASVPSFAGGFLIALVNLFGMIAGFITWVVLKVSSQWIPLCLAILLLQTAGMAGPEQSRRWVSKGVTALWILLLAKPMVILVFRVGQAGMANSTGLDGYLVAILTLASCAVAPYVMWRMFPVGDGGPVGLVKALAAGAGSAMALHRMGGGASRQPGQSRESMNDKQSAAMIGDGDDIRPAGGQPAAAGGPARTRRRVPAGPEFGPGVDRAARSARRTRRPARLVRRGRSRRGGGSRSTAAAESTDATQAGAAGSSGAVRPAPKELVGAGIAGSAVAGAGVDARAGAAGEADEHSQVPSRSGAATRAGNGAVAVGRRARAAGSKTPETSGGAEPAEAQSAPGTPPRRAAPQRRRRARKGSPW